MAENLSHSIYFEKWIDGQDLERHTRRDWLIRIRKQFVDDGLLETEELIERVSTIGGYSARL